MLSEEQINVLPCHSAVGRQGEGRVKADGQGEGRRAVSAPVALA